MDPNPFFGVILHAIGGLAAASFYIPYKKVRGWAWESYWIVGGFFSWIIAPWIVSALKTPHLAQVLREAPTSSLLYCYLFGILWGIGGLTFGLTMRYLGMSLGYALALGFCAAFGTVIPPLFNGELAGLLSKLSGQTIMGGMLVCLVGIAICGKAGIQKEKELSDSQKKASIKEFNFSKGLWVAIFAGVMSACMAFGIAAGKPITELAVKYGTPDLWKNSPTYIIIFAGGFSVNVIWCLLLNKRNQTGGDYLKAGTPLLLNYLFSALAGATWYLQFMFYGMGTTQMGRYDFSSWTLHMAFIIIFSNIWGILFFEWRGSSRRTHTLIATGILVLIISTLIVGRGNYIDSQVKKAPPAPAAVHQEALKR